MTKKKHDPTSKAPPSKKEMQKAARRAAAVHDPALRPFADLLARCQEIPDAILDEGVIEKIADVASTSPTALARLRQVLKDLDAPVVELEKLVKTLLASRRRAEADRVKAEAKQIKEQQRQANGQATQPRKKRAESDDEQPYIPRLTLNDATIERAAMIAAKQPRGLFVVRDELSGLIGNTGRYTKNGSDRAFWIESYNGGSYSVERVTRSANDVDRLTIGLMGGMQPDKLSSLLINVDDDGMLARLMTFWPNPVPVGRPKRGPDNAWAERAFARLYDIPMLVKAPGSAPEPVLVARRSG